MFAQAPKPIINYPSCHRQKNHDTNLAIQDLSKAIALDPVYAEALYERGLLYSLIGKQDESRPTREKRWS